MEDLSNIFIFIATGYIAILSWMGNREIKRVDKLEGKVEGHDKRIQSIEDIQGNKIDDLTLMLKELKSEVKQDVKNINKKIDALATHIHNEKNQENQLTQAIKLLYKHLEKIEGGNRN
jgi:cell division septum initiation protein DivIVA